MHAVYSAPNYSTSTTNVTEKTNAFTQKTWLLLLCVEFLEYCSSTQHYSTAFFPKKSTCIASTALQNTLVSALLADVAIVLSMEVILCLHSILGHFLFTTKVKDLSLIIGYN